MTTETGFEDSSSNLGIKKTSVLVTGHKGVIGTELVKLLEGRTVTGIDKKDGQDLATLDVQSVLDSASPEVVFHLAATFERTSESPEALTHIFENDTLSSHRLIEAVAKTPSVKTFVFASSYLIYRPVGEVLREHGEVRPRNLCGMSKLYTERELEFLCSSIRPDIRVINARIFRVYGVGSKDIIGRWCFAKKAGEEVVIHNEENIFDFIYAQDVAEGLKRLAFTPEVRGVVNLGTGHGRSVKEVCGLIGVKTRKGEDMNEREATKAYTGYLQLVTGWTPPTTLEEGIEKVMSA